MANASDCDIYQFKITLKYIWPPIWRRIQVPKDYTFKDMSETIITAMGWLNCHSHVFNAEDYDIGRIYEGIDDEEICGRKMIDEATMKLSEYFKAPKDGLIYEYDSGDSWEHAVVLEKILRRNSKKEYPVCIAGKRACPPEDCGGANGYKYHLEIMSDRNHEEHAERKKWLKSRGYAADWKPEIFDPKSIDFKNSWF